MDEGSLYDFGLLCGGGGAHGVDGSSICSLVGIVVDVVMIHGPRSVRTVGWRPHRRGLVLVVHLHGIALSGNAGGRQDGN